MHRRDRLIAPSPGLPRRIHGHRGRRPEPGRDRGGRARCRGGARCGTTADGFIRAAAASRMDGETLGAAAGRRGGVGNGRIRRHICCSPTPISSMPRMRSGDSSARARGGRLCAHLADGEACAARAWPSACSSRPSFSSFRCCIRSPGRIIRAAPPPPRPAAACWCAAMYWREAGGMAAIRDALIDDCALAKAAQGARRDLDRSDRSRPQPPRLSGDRGHPPHGFAHRLCAVAIFAAAACRHRFWLGADLSRAGCARAVSRRAWRSSSAFSPGC